MTRQQNELRPFGKPYSNGSPICLWKRISFGKLDLWQEFVEQLFWWKHFHLIYIVIQLLICPLIFEALILIPFYGLKKTNSHFVLYSLCLSQINVAVAVKCVQYEYYRAIIFFCLLLLLLYIFLSGWCVLYVCFILPNFRCIFTFKWMEFRTFRLSLRDLIAAIVGSRWICQHHYHHHHVHRQWRIYTFISRRKGGGVSKKIANKFKHFIR